MNNRSSAEQPPELILVVRTKYGQKDLVIKFILSWWYSLLGPRHLPAVCFFYPSSVIIHQGLDSTFELSAESFLCLGFFGPASQLFQIFESKEMVNKKVICITLTVASVTGTCLIFHIIISSFTVVTYWLSPMLSTNCWIWSHTFYHLIYRLISLQYLQWHGWIDSLNSLKIENVSTIKWMLRLYPAIILLKDTRWLHFFNYINPPFSSDKKKD